jgi:hypothetical protein
MEAEFFPLRGIVATSSDQQQDQEMVVKPLWFEFGTKRVNLTLSAIQIISSQACSNYLFFMEKSERMY